MGALFARPVQDGDCPVELAMWTINTRRGESRIPTKPHTITPCPSPRRPAIPSAQQTELTRNASSTRIPTVRYRYLPTRNVRNRPQPRHTRTKSDRIRTHQLNDEPNPANYRLSRYRSRPPPQSKTRTTSIIRSTHPARFCPVHPTNHQRSTLSNGPDSPRRGKRSDVQFTVHSGLIPPCAIEPGQRGRSTRYRAAICRSWWMGGARER